MCVFFPHDKCSGLQLNSPNVVRYRSYWSGNDFGPKRLQIKAQSYRLYESECLYCHCTTARHQHSPDDDTVDWMGVIAASVCTSIVAVDVCSVASSPICRICHEAGVREALLSPCKCRGTLGLVHRSCIERWLSTANTDSCEICSFRYQTVRKARSFREVCTSVFS